MNATALALTFAFLLIFALGIALPILLGSPSDRKLREQRLTPLPTRPSIDVIVPAYLEVSEIAEKVVGLRKALQGYEGVSTVTVMASDDATAEAAVAAGADTVVACGRNGKPAATNEGVERSTADIVVFTDANCQIEPITWPVLVVEDLRDWALVSSDKQEAASTEGLYWKIEKRIKGGDPSTLRPSLGVVGEFIALRRSDFRPVPPRTILDDMWLALDLNERGLISTVDSRIWTTEAPASRRDQWERRLRICEGLFTEALPRARALAADEFGRRHLAHKLYRVTIGAAAFWAAVLAFCFVAPPWTAVLAVGGSALAVTWYAGLLPVGLPLSGAFTAVAMQAVPPASVVRIIRKRMRKGEQSAGWKKVAR